MQLIEKRQIPIDTLNTYILDNVISPMQSKLRTFWDNYDNFQNYFHKIDAVRKWKIFRDLLKPLKTHNRIYEFLETNRTYQTQVIDIRNKFAHAKANNDNGILVLKGQLGQEGFQFDTEACIQIRKDLMNHKKNIERLKEALSGI